MLLTITTIHRPDAASSRAGALVRCRAPRILSRAQSALSAAETVEAVGEEPEAVEEGPA
ncbi:MULTISPECIES: hypothetical protein [Sorangium]|uniref:hypothetical protein n=1 Tax=Sorangium TaxID=39643 RepID=UPI003D9C187C